VGFGEGIKVGVSQVLEGYDFQRLRKVDSGTSAAKAVFEIKAFNAALEALLHPNQSFSATSSTRAVVQK
jgi:hypothetical protein